MRIALSTGGGDAPGLNAVIRGAVLAAVSRGWSVYGIQRGYGGLLGNDRVVSLGADEVRGITHVGGTILGTTNRGDPFKWPTPQPDGSIKEVDRSDDILAAFAAHGFDALVTIGGDGSLRIAQKLYEKGLPLVGVPKTIDNDVSGTVMTFGFDTAVSTATDALDKVHSTAESHDRVMVVEVMGRYAGWIALNAGLSGSADVILIPEIPFDIESVCRKIRERDARGRRFSVVVVAEGATSKGGGHVVQASAAPGGMERLGGIAAVVAKEIEVRTGKETRALTLGHLQRGGTPTTFDRLLSLRFGAAAIRCIAGGTFGVMVALTPPTVSFVSLKEALAKPKLVPLDADTILTAREIGVCLGD
ncbi:MAG: ATP-dependent 6-phosphofructokinase [Gemmatimonadetes bacterium]|nr:ATP-dependent 6-phosphofructokinase [Gemmatimonadota bacterium]